MVFLNYTKIMARPLEFVKEVALEKAMEVFWEKGFEAASLLDLIEAMGLSKSSFYQAFKSKHDLYTAALNHYVELMSANLSRSLEAAPSGLAFIENTFMEIAENAQLRESQRGCFLMNTATEFAQKNEEIAILTGSGLKKFESVFARAVKKAQADGEISLSKNAETLADYLVCNMSGIKSMVKAGIKPAVLKPIVNTIIVSLK